MKDVMRLLGTIGAHALFWGWNGLFVLVLWLGMGPALVAQMLVATAVGIVPWHITAFVLLLMGIPVAAMALGLWKLRRDPGRLLSMFYGVQAPLMLLCLVRIFAVGQLTAATTLALAVVAVGTMGLLRTLLSGFEERSTVAQVARLAAQSTWLVVGLWWAGLVAIYAVALTAATGVGVLEVLVHPSEWLAAPTLGVFAAFLWATVVVVMVFPLAMLGVSLRSWQLVHRHSIVRLGRTGAWGVTVATVGALLIGFALTSRQPQRRAFAWIEQATTDAGRVEALDHSELVRRGLVNARLSSERTFDADPYGDHVEAMYDDWVGDTLAGLPQGLWCGLMAPFVYHPFQEGQVYRLGGRGWAVPADVGEAEEAYAAFFDAPMGRAERDALVAAGRQTWSWRSAEASLLDVGQQRVHLDRQQIDVEPHGDVAVVTIHDVYRSRSWEREEVLLAFSLPETAAVTGLWLGPDEDRATAFTHVVAPRGAAQEVYKEQVRRRVDPALLEQVGPRQYRLRAFPVEPREGSSSDVWSLTSEGPELHLWLEVVVPRTDEGWPLPRLAETRNLFWDTDTRRVVDGRPADTDAWTPARVDAPTGPRGTLRAVVSGLQVVGTPVRAAASADPGAMVVLVDGTRSMEAHRDEVGAALERLRAVSRSVDVFCTREGRVGACADFDPSTALFWGARPLEDQLRDLPATASTVVVLTDEGSYELATPDPTPLDWARGPLWLVHLGSAMPVAYPDPTLDALQRSGGGVAGSVEELLARLADPSVRDGWTWSVHATDEADSTGPVARIAARRAIAALDLGARGELEHLDQVHALAVGQSVVTQYSSMIVLVDEAQREALRRAEEREDRFDREVEAGTAEFSPVSSAPEPGTWLLLAAGGGLMLAGRRRRASVDAG